MSERGLVFVVDDDPGVRESIRALLEAAGYGVISFGDANAFLDYFAEGMSGCLVLDVRLPGMSGMELQAKLTRRHPALPVILITGHGEVSMAVKAMKYGAVDFLEKPYRGHQLRDCVARAMKAGKEFQCRKRYDEKATKLVSSLSKAEFAVFKRVIKGEFNKAIGNSLNISVSTVEARRKSLMEKLSAENLADLILIFAAYERKKKRKNPA